MRTGAEIVGAIDVTHGQWIFRGDAEHAIAAAFQLAVERVPGDPVGRTHKLRATPGDAFDEIRGAVHVADDSVSSVLFSEELELHVAESVVFEFVSVAEQIARGVEA